MRGHFWFLGFSLVLLGIQLGFVGDLVRFALGNDFASHIVLVPALSMGLVFLKRKMIFRDASPSLFLGGLVILGGILMLVVGGYLGVRADGSNYFSWKTLCLLVIWVGGFLGCYGRTGFRNALFPILFLVLAIPIPEVMLQGVISFLQKGSADVVAALFHVTGTPFQRQEFLFQLPGINILIAPECSGIRSSLALLITTTLAAQLMLRTRWRKAAAILVAAPMALIKNGVRIATLSWLAIHVDPRYITGSDLHRRGGVLFFILALLLMTPVFWVLRRSERKPAPVSPPEEAKTQGITGAGS